MQWLRGGGGGETCELGAGAGWLAKEARFSCGLICGVIRDD